MKPIEIVNAIEIDCDPRVARAFVLDYENDVRWREGVLLMRADGPLRAGVRTYEELSFLGSRYVTKGEVTECEQGRLSFRAENASAEVEGYRAVEAHAAGTRVRYALRMHMRGPMALFAPLVRMLYARRVAGDLRRLQALLSQRQGESRPESGLVRDPLLR